LTDQHTFNPVIQRLATAHAVPEKASSGYVIRSGCDGRR
jgi:hypothetical protein